MAFQNSLCAYCSTWEKGTQEMKNNSRDLRISLLMTQAELVRRVNVPGFDVSMLSKIENGHCLPTPEVENALKSTLQATTDELYGSWKEVPIKGVGARVREFERFPDAPWEIKELVSCLKVGKENAKSRAVLRAELQIKDRLLRKRIEIAQSMGYMIANNSDGEGYYICADEKEAEYYYRQEMSRIRSTMSKLESFRRFLAERGIDL